MLISIYDVPIKNTDKLDVLRQAIVKALLPKKTEIGSIMKKCKSKVVPTRHTIRYYDLQEVIDLISHRKQKAKTDVRYYQHWAGILKVLKGLL